ncbi:MAG: hypothetical protein R3F18_09540 [Lysobacterales bacterium]|nr:hypothetical protein [Xanthomonadales bacterium]MCP5474262.1 hypothetical protein [Rhodanobacteraceae bacterium]
MKFATIHKPVSIALYVLSLGMPGYYVGSPHGFFEYLGIYNLVLGWLGLLFGQVAWFANPLFLLSFRKISQKSSAKLAIWSLAVALTFLVNPRMVRNTAQMGEIIHGFGLGYALWVSAIAVMAIGQYRMSQGHDKLAAAKPALGTAAGILALYVVYFFLFPIPESLAIGIFGR